MRAAEGGGGAAAERVAAARRRRGGGGEGGGGGGGGDGGGGKGGGGVAAAREVVVTVVAVAKAVVVTAVVVRVVAAREVAVRRRWWWRRWRRRGEAKVGEAREMAAAAMARGGELMVAVETVVVRREGGEGGGGDGRVEAVMEVVVRARVAVAIERVVAVTVEGEGRVGVAKGVAVRWDRLCHSTRQWEACGGVRHVRALQCQSGSVEADVSQAHKEDLEATLRLTTVPKATVRTVPPDPLARCGRVAARSQPPCPASVPLCSSAGHILEPSSPRSSSSVGGIIGRGSQLPLHHAVNVASGRGEAVAKPSCGAPSRM